MKTFYVFRHGQTDFNVRNVWQGTSINAPLNDNGFAQAAKLGEKLQGLGMQEIYSSPMLRALQTAGEVNNVLQLEIRVANDLHECCFGEADGKEFNFVQEKYPHIVHDFLYPTPKTWDIKYPGESSESKHDVFVRVNNVLMQIAKQSKADVIGISTHGGVMSSLLAGLGSFGIELPNCCVAKISYDEESETPQFVEMM